MAMADTLHLKLVLILTVGFGFASILGYLTYRAKLSPLLGYLLAGYLIGPYSPGFVADLHLAEQMAEIGVILMMFGVGLHFKAQDLLKTSHIAVPGALLQTFCAALVTTLLVYEMGWPIETGIIFGLAIGVASTVVLVRVLNDNHLLNTTQGHISVGWLIVEDIITVGVMLLLPTLAFKNPQEDTTTATLVISFLIVLLKFLLLLAVVFTFGKKIVTFILSKVEKTESHELFTLTVLAITFFIAAGSTFLFGTSIALGSFLAGMLIGQTTVRQHVTTITTPLKDAFVVIFFLSVGMLFNPSAMWDNPLLFLGILGVVLVIKPVTAFIIMRLYRYPFQTALTVAFALAQIGEFSFILAEESLKYKILPDEGYDLIVACSLFSISINPLLFKLLTPHTPKAA